MEIKVSSKHLKISPRKLRPVVNMVRGKNLVKAMATLKFVPNKGAKFIVDLLTNAQGIAKNHDLALDNMYISVISCSDGSRLKRGTPASKGSMMPITKRSSHLYINVSDASKDVKPKKEKD